MDTRELKLSHLVENKTTIYIIWTRKTKEWFRKASCKIYFAK